MSAAKKWYVRSREGSVYGPADAATLVAWAEEGRIEPSGFVSGDRRKWIPAQMMPELGMTWVVEAEPGKFFGPFNRKMVIGLAKDGSIPEGAAIYRRHTLAVDRDPPPKVKVVEKIVEKVVEKIVEKRVEVPVEKIVEKIVEVPVEKIVERIIEVEPPPRKELVEPVADAVTTQVPPPPALGGIFRNVDPSRLAALEAAARRELAAANGARLGMMSGLFKRRDP